MANDATQPGFQRVAGGVSKKGLRSRGVTIVNRPDRSLFEIDEVTLSAAYPGASAPPRRRSYKTNNATIARTITRTLLPERTMTLREGTLKLLTFSGTTCTGVGRAPYRGTLGFAATTGGASRAPALPRTWFEVVASGLGVPQLVENRSICST